MGVWDTAVDENNHAPFRDVPGDSVQKVEHLHGISSVISSEKPELRLLGAREASVEGTGHTLWSWSSSQLPPFV